MHSTVTSKNVSGFTLAGLPCILPHLIKDTPELIADLLKCSIWSSFSLSTLLINDYLKSSKLIMVSKFR